MKCVECGDTVLDGFARSSGGLCKGCLRAKKPQAAPVPEAPPAPPPALAPAPQGFRYLYNRTGRVYECLFDGIPIVFQPHETKLLPCDTAERLRAPELILGTLRAVPGSSGSMQAERNLALGPGWSIAASHKQDDGTFTYEYAPAEAEPAFLVPTTTAPGAELFDRTSVPNYVGRASRENVPTTAHLIHV